MNRRDFFRRATMVAAGVVAADQLELLDRLGWTRTMFPSAAVPRVVGPGMIVTDADLSALFRKCYSDAVIGLRNAQTPFLAQLIRPTEPRSLFAPASPSWGGSGAYWDSVT